MHRVHDTWGDAQGDAHVDGVQVMSARQTRASARAREMGVRYGMVVSADVCSAGSLPQPLVMLGRTGADRPFLLSGRGGGTMGVY